MDTLQLDLITPENPSNPIRVSISKQITLKSFLSIAEKALSIEIYSLYVNNLRLADMNQLNNGNTVVAMNCVSPNVSKNSHFFKTTTVESTDLDFYKKSDAIKVAVLGPHGAGKSSLILKFVHGFFKSNSISTIIGAEYEKTIHIKGKDVAMSIFDTAGELDYDICKSAQPNDIKAYLLVIGFDQLSDWHLLIKYHKLIKQTVANPLILLLVTKIDLYDCRDQTSNLKYREIMASISTYSKDNGLLMLKTSSKTNKNIQKVFYTIASRLLNNDENRPIALLNRPIKYKNPFFFRIIEKLSNWRLNCTGSYSSN